MTLTQKPTMLVTDHVHSWPAEVPYHRQAAEVPGTKKPGQTGIYHNAIFGFINKDTPGSFQTVDEIFKCGLKGGRDRKMLGHRPLISTSPLKFANYYVWQTYGEVDLRRRWIGSALVKLFSSGQLGGGEFETVGIWSQNRPEWQVIDIALQSYKKVGVSLYDTLGKDAVEYIINHSHLTTIFTTADHIPALLKLAPSIPIVKLIVSIDPLPTQAWNIMLQWSQTVGVQLKKLSEIEELGRANLMEPIPATPEQLTSICYTSGTTSNPKGVLLTHRNMAIATQSNLYGLLLPEDGSLLSFLPLAHIYERVTEFVCIAMGASIGYFSGDPLRLMEDAQILKPAMIPAVPRVFNRIYQGAMAAGDVPGLKGALFRYAVQTKLYWLRETGTVTHALWDRLVFRKVKAVLGGQMETMICGSAPINKDVLDFLKIAMCCNILEGYGLTETCATTTRAIPDDPTAGGTVGPPQPANEIKLIDVPAMNYTSEDKPFPRGELCIRGDNCFAVYYKDEKNTQETVDAEGWLHTGDVAAIDDCGRVKIIDRVKNIMKLSQGEYVALEKIENTYGACPVVAQIYIHGDSMQAYLLAVVVPDPIQLAAIVSDVTGNKVTPDNTPLLLQACKDSKINHKVLSILTQEAKKNGLKGFETIKRIHLSMDPFTVDNGTLTPTLKIRRKDAYSKYKAELDGLYALGEPTSEVTTRL